jgi:hypothetical protein
LQPVANKANFFIKTSLPPEHEDWVLELATKLMDDGIEVVFDKWDLKEGQDIFAFMESMVTSPDISKVLVICDKGYRDKANNRIGGVGTETQIITKEVYSKAHQEKFIRSPTIRNKNFGNGYCIFIQNIPPSISLKRKYLQFATL